MAKLIQVIENYEVRGTGTKDDPMRRVLQFWSPEGELLIEHDPLTFVDAPKEMAPEDQDYTR